MNFKTIVKTVSIIALASSPALEAFASGYYSPGAGIRSISRGTADALSGDTGNASYNNPANLVRVDGTQFNVDFIMSKPQLKWTPTGGSCRDRKGILRENCDAVSNEGAWFPIPGVFITSDFDADLWGLTAGLAVYGPLGGFYKYPYDPKDQNELNDSHKYPHRYSIIESKLLQVIYELSLAIEPVKYIRIGAGVALNQLEVNIDKIASSNNSDLTEDYMNDTFDVRNKIKTKDFKPSFSGGLVVHIPFNDAPNYFFMELGGSFRSGFTMKGDGDIDVAFPEGVNSRLYKLEGEKKVTIERADVTLQTKMPWLIYSGIRFGQKDFWDFELNFTYETWSGMSTIDIYPDEVFVEMEGLGDVPFPKHIIDDRQMRNAMGFYGGGSIKLHDMFALRAGGGWQQGAIPDAAINPQLIDRDKIIVGLGGTVSVWLFDIDVGVSYHHMGKWTIEDKEAEYKVLAIMLTPEEAREKSPAMNQGDYSAWSLFFGAGLTFHIDGLWRKNVEEAAAPEPDHSEIRDRGEKAVEELDREADTGENK